MPRTPRGHKRPADVISNAVQVMQIATGEIDESRPVFDGRDLAAVELGRKGGQARAMSLSATKRRQIARKAAQERWRKAK
jgi:hypothetical protein